VRGGEIDFFGSAQSDVEHVGTGVSQSPGERVGQHRTAQANVVAHDDTRRTHDVDIRTADAVGHVLIQLIRQSPADVVGLETVKLHDDLPCEDVLLR